LSGYAHLVALTNTKAAAACHVLSKLGLSIYLEYIMGRGTAPCLKPAPDGMLALLASYPTLLAADVVAVGDAIIDIQAARGAGFKFCAYNRSRLEQWQVAGYKLELQLHQWDERAARQLLLLLDCRGG
ncbi:MAG: HAD hydrolase-like protein, partial [Clostridiales bacterium]|nr:HAD hydrolase-like protein [Clostridiales bacterium]